MLRITRQLSEGVCTQDVLDAIARSKQATGQVVVLVPSVAQARSLQRFLAQQGFGLGVAVDTPSGWLAERWALLGDGRQPVDGIQRLLLVSCVLKQHAKEGEDAGLGTVKTLSSLVEQALPWLSESACACDALTAREQEVVSIAQAYEAAANRRGLVEQSRMFEQVPQLLAKAGIGCTAILVGFARMGIAMRNLAVQLARTNDVEALVPAGPGAAFRQADALAAQLEHQASEAGIDCVCETASPCLARPERHAELQQLLCRLFFAGQADPIARTTPNDGAVEVLMPAGPLSQARAVADKLAALAAEGKTDLVVVAPDVKAAWQQLAPRLACSGIETHAAYRVRPTDTEAGKSFAALAESVAELSLAQEDVDAHAGSVVEAGIQDVALASTQLRQASMGDMQWWPPRKVLDFLLSDISRVERRQAWGLDKLWRSTRALAPHAVLDALGEQEATSKTCATATNLLRAGDICAAAAALKRPCEQALRDALDDREGLCAPADVVALKEQVAVLEAFEAAARQVALMHEEVDDTRGDGAPCASDLSDRIEEVVIAASALRVAVRPIAQAQTEHASMQPVASPDQSGGAAMQEEKPACVRIMSAYEAARLEPCSCDALVYLELDTTHAPVGSRASAAAQLLDKLGIEPKAPAIDAARWSFLSCARVPRSRLVVERCAHGPRATDAYPAAMLAELLACYPEAYDAQGRSAGSVLLPASNAPETAVMENLLACEDALFEQGDIARTGVPLENLLLLASRQRSDYGDEDEQALHQEDASGSASGVRAPAPACSVLLSPTQIETYLHCPQKWLAEKRLGLSSIDAACGPLQEGAFAHEVLERTYRSCKGCAKADPLEAFDACFAQALTRQFASDASDPASGVLVPHSKNEDFRMARLYRNLRETIAFSKERFAGFAPTFFELGFGLGHLPGHEGEPDVSLGAIALCGSIDRVDVFVDEAGRQHALVVDYKRSKHMERYALSFIEGPDDAQELPDPNDEGRCADGSETVAPEELPLPFHVQGLLYAWALRHLARDPQRGPLLGLDPGLKVIGAVYLGTGEARTMSGAVDAAFADRVFGPCDYPGAPKREDVVVQLQPYASDFKTFDDYLDAFEQALAHQLQRLLGAHDVAPRPWGKEDKTSLCAYCSVSRCPARRAG